MLCFVGSERGRVGGVTQEAGSLGISYGAESLYINHCGTGRTFGVKVLVHSVGIGFQTTRRSHEQWVETRCGPQGGSFQTAQSHSLAI